jgi:hypothetical protein
MMKWISVLVVFWATAVCGGLRAVETPSDPVEPKQADLLVAQMRGISMRPGPGVTDDGKIVDREQRRLKIVDGFCRLGLSGLPALIRALHDPDVQMRRNVVLVLASLAGTWEGPPPLVIREALPALITALGDDDSDVKGWAAQDIGLIGADAKVAVPDLIRLLKNSDEGLRNSACIALGDIGPAAKDALPALRKALSDPSKDVRRFAQIAIEKIESK